MEIYWYEFIVQEFKRNRWIQLKSFSDLPSAEAFAESHAHRSLERTRVIRVDISLMKYLYYAR